MSIKVSDVAFVGYPVSDMKRAKDFYEQILGLKVGEAEHEIPVMPGKSWAEYEVGSQTLALSNAWEPSGQNGPSIALEVEDFEEAVKHLKNEGVKILAECIDTPVCKIALIEDPDGNGITIHKRH